MIRELKEAYEPLSSFASLGMEGRESSSPRGLEGLETITMEGIVRGAGAGSWEWQGGSWSGVGGHSRPTFQVLVRCK